MKCKTNKQTKKVSKNDVKVAGFSTQDGGIALVIETRGVWRYVITSRAIPHNEDRGSSASFWYQTHLWKLLISQGQRQALSYGGEWSREAHSAAMKPRAQLRLRSMQKHPLAPSQRSAGAYWDGDCGEFARWKVIESPFVSIERIQLIKRELTESIGRVASQPGWSFDELLTNRIASQHTEFMAAWGKCNFKWLCSYTCDLTHLALPMHPLLTWTSYLIVKCYAPLATQLQLHAHDYLSLCLLWWWEPAFFFFASFERNWQQFPRVHGTNTHSESSNC